MMRLLACSLCVFLATVALAEDELPKDPETSVEVEPPFRLAFEGRFEPCSTAPLADPGRLQIKA